MSAHEGVKKPALKAAFGKKAAPGFSLKREVAGFYALFPEFREEVFFIDLARNQIVHPDKKASGALKAAMRKNPKLANEVQRDAARAAARQSSFCKEVMLEGKSVRFLALYLAPDMMNLLDKDIHTLSMSRYCVFDHELAHAIVEGARSHALLAECVADAFMTIRHIQRFGKESPLPDIICKRRAAYAFFNQDDVHFTSPAIEQVIALKNKINYKNLTPAETMRLSEVIGALSLPSRGEMAVLKKQFGRQKNALRRVTTDKPLRDFAQAVLSSRSSLMRQWGRVALAGFLDGDIHLRRREKGKEPRAIALRGKYWDSLRRDILPKPRRPRVTVSR